MQNNNENNTRKFYTDVQSLPDLSLSDAYSLIDLENTTDRSQIISYLQGNHNLSARMVLLSLYNTGARVINFTSATSRSNHSKTSLMDIYNEIPIEVVNSYTEYGKSVNPNRLLYILKVALSYLSPDRIFAFWKALSNQQATHSTAIVFPNGSRFLDCNITKFILATYMASNLERFNFLDDADVESLRQTQNENGFSLFIYGQIANDRLQNFMGSTLTQPSTSLSPGSIAPFAISNNNNANDGAEQPVFSSPRSSSVWQKIKNFGVLQPSTSNGTQGKLDTILEEEPKKPSDFKL